MSRDLSPSSPVELHSVPSAESAIGWPLPPCGQSVSLHPELSLSLTSLGSLVKGLRFASLFCVLSPILSFCSHVTFHLADIDLGRYKRYDQNHLITVVWIRSSLLGMCDIWHNWWVSVNTFAAPHA